MGDSYIPAEDGLALTWMNVFSAGIAADVAKYQVSLADSNSITSAVNDFAAAYALAVNPATRTPVNVNGKDQARFVAEEICRQFAVQIKYNVGISDQDKIAIGVRPINTSRDPIDPPASSPLLNIIGATPGSHTIRYADTATPDSGAKPFGAMQIQIFVAVKDAPTVNEDDAQFYGAFTKNPIGVQFDAGDDGKCATYFARWATRKGETGPWSLPVSMRIAA
jgi:hypothetical protein